MFNIFTKYFCKFTLLILAGLGYLDTSIAAEKINNLIISSNKGSELQLEVRQAPLSEILDNISKKTHIPIHYSVLPEGLISATCVGSNLKPVLECLLAKKVDLVFRNSQNPSKTDEIAEVWITGSNFAATINKNESCIAAVKNLNTQPTQTTQELEFDRRDELLSLSESKDPEVRAAAIGSILTDPDAHKDDPAIKAALEKALADKNPSVRAQAISTLAQFEGDDTTALLQEALHDESVDVRLTAVGGITGNNLNLLQQAFNDSDETVRVLATAKFKELNNTAE